MWMKHAVVAVFLLWVAPLGYSATIDCSGGAYERGLCWYSAGELDRAEVEFGKVIEREPIGDEMLKAVYFLARTKMGKEQWDEASRLWIRLFELSPAFYRNWNGDYLLGVCRRELGKG